MKTIDLSGQPFDLNEILRLASESNLLLRTSDGKEFVIAEIDDFAHEVALTRDQPELSALLEERSKPGRTFSEIEVREMLGLGETQP